MQPSRDDVLVRVAEAASETLKTPIEELPPLRSVVDPEALVTLITSPEKPYSSPVMVRFEYAGLEIIMHGQELIFAHPIDEVQDTPDRPVDFNS